MVSAYVILSTIYVPQPVLAAYDYGTEATPPRDKVYNANFIDMTRISLDGKIFQDSNPFDDHAGYTRENEEGCTDTIRIDADSYRRGNGNWDGDELDSGNLYGRLTITYSQNSECEEYDRINNNVLLRNRGMRSVLAYQINDNVFWMPEAANYHFNNTGDPYGPQTFKKVNERDTEWLIVTDGEPNDFDNGGARIDSRETGASTIRYQMNDCAQLGCSTTTLDAKLDEPRNRIVYTGNRPNATVYPDAPGEDEGIGGDDEDNIGETTEADAGTPDCEGGGLSFVICPLVEGLASLADGIVETFLRPILRAEILDLPGSNDAESEALYNVWKGFRNIANALLILAFLAIIISTAMSSE